jgi:RNA polymerase sigma-70 factor, ECF subfamily
VSTETVKQRFIATIPNLRAFAVSLCGNLERADDLVQETMFKAFKHIDSFEDGTNLKAWLFTILRNTYFSERRRLKREVEDADGVYAARVGVHPEQHGHMDMCELQDALKLLPDDQREALILICAAGLSYEEAAAISGCAVGTIKSRVNRARVKLSDIMGITSASEFGPDAATEAVLSGTAGHVRHG